MKPRSGEKPPTISNSISHAFLSEHSILLVALALISSFSLAATNRSTSVPPHGAITFGWFAEDGWLVIIKSYLISEIDSKLALKMLKDGDISGGMIPKLNTCLDAVNNGVTGVVIVDGRKPHSILFELFSDKGAGTLIRK